MLLFRRVRRYTRIQNHLRTACWVSCYVFLIVMLVTPLRNILVPYWPRVYRDMSTFK
ncbi:unnamed protein product, partial [Candidula unifasciata]